MNWLVSLQFWTDCVGNCTKATDHCNENNAKLKLKMTEIELENCFTSTQDLIFHAPKELCDKMSTSRSVCYSPNCEEDINDDRCCAKPLPRKLFAV